MTIDEAYMHLQSMRYNMSLQPIQKVEELRIEALDLAMSTMDKLSRIEIMFDLWEELGEDCDTIAFKEFKKILKE